MTVPQRIQIYRAAGWRMPPNTVRVDRATKWGNPYRADRPMPENVRMSGAKSAAQAFRFWLTGHAALMHDFPERRAAILASIGELAGKDLACWCAPRDECHADVLLEMAAAVAHPLVAVPPQTGDLPTLALSVRQPWAWAIFHGKDIENRDWRKPNPGLAFRGRVAIHASTGMTQLEYENAADFMLHTCGVTAPPPHQLVRGAIIGSVDVADVMRRPSNPCIATSPWFVGPVGLVLRDPRSCQPIAAKGALGFFAWQPGGEFAHPARWMLPRPAPTAITNPQGELL